MTTRNHQKKTDVRIASGGRDAFDARLNDIVRRAVEKVAENAQKIIASRAADQNKDEKRNTPAGG